MSPTPTGFAAAPTPLGDGAVLTSSIDLRTHHIEVTAGTDRLGFDLREGPSPSVIGTAINRLVTDHGARIPVDPGRFASSARQDYDPSHGEAFFDEARAAIEAFDVLNAGLAGEVAGPHLWPHGFDIATEWYSDRVVAADGHEGNAQITTGWYPSVESYVYVNPWPFDDAFSAIDLPGAAWWHLDGWQGAKLDVLPGEALAIEEIVALARAVHAATVDALGA